MKKTMKRILLNAVWLVAVALLSAETSTSSVAQADKGSISFEIGPYLQIERKIEQVEMVPGESEFQKRERVAKEQEEMRSKRQLVARERTSYSTTVNLGSLRGMYQEKAAEYGISWKLLEAVHQVESGKSTGCTARSHMGATGPFQFLPSTFRSYAAPGANICDLGDSMTAAAKYLAASGADRGDIDSALFSYNHSWSYVRTVKAVMGSIE